MKLLIKNPEGRYIINGEVKLQGAKNAMLNNLLLPLLTNDECIFENVPRINDVLTNLKYLESLGAAVQWITDSSIKIRCSQIKYKDLDSQTAYRTTGSKYFVPFMVHRFGKFITGPSGGDKLGSRAFADYAESLSFFGISYEQIEPSLYKFWKSSDPLGSEHNLKFPSLGLTINSIFAALTCGSDITITNSCLEAEIDNTIDIINQMGGDVQRIAPDSIIVRKKNLYKGGVFRNMSDRNVAVSYAMFALVTQGKITLTNFSNVKMEAFYHFLDQINCKYLTNGDSLFIDAANINKDSQRIKAYMYPEIHSDWQPLIAPLLIGQTGTSYIEEFLFPSRLEYWMELSKMGAKFEFDTNNSTRFTLNGDRHAVYIYGPSVLKGASVRAIDLRAGMCLIIASLNAKGDTLIENAEEIYRGYDKIDMVLRALGVSIELIN